MRGKEHGTIWVLNAFTALTGVAQLVGHHPPKQKVAGSVLGQGISVGYRFRPQLGHV